MSSNLMSPDVQEVAADVLATAVDKAVKLERERSDRETTVAVASAKREAEVDHKLQNHDEHFAVINGSIIRSAKALESVKETVTKFVEKQDERNTVWDTEQKLHWKEKGQAFSKKQVYTGYTTLVIMFLTVIVPQIAKLFE